MVNARIKSRKFTNILSTEMKDIKERYPYFELEIEQYVIQLQTFFN